MLHTVTHTHMHAHDIHNPLAKAVPVSWR